MNTIQNIAHIFGSKTQFSHFWRGGGRICMVFSRIYPLLKHILQNILKTTITVQLKLSKQGKLWYDCFRNRKRFELNMLNRREIELPCNQNEMIQTLTAIKLTVKIHEWFKLMNICINLQSIISHLVIIIVCSSNILHCY